jgi:hypothetical protein
MKRFICIVTAVIVFAAMSAAKTYYVDPANGDDTGIGSADQPLQTMARTLELQDSPPVRAKAASGEGITFILKGGNYGAFNLTDANGPAKAAGSGGWTTYKAAPGEKPLFTSMDFNFETLTPLYIKFDGIHIESPPPPPGRAKAAIVPTKPLSLIGLTDMVFENGSILGATMQTTGGSKSVYMDGCRNITFRRNKIGQNGRAIQFTKCQNIKILYNNIGWTSSTAIYIFTGNSNTLIEGNHIHHQRTWEGSHSSAISFYSNGVVVRGNEIHDGYGSSGMMFYPKFIPSFNNITIENNVMYDIRNVYLLRLQLIGNNVVVRNNTLIGSYYVGKTDCRYHMQVCFNYNLASGSDGSGLSVYNNIMYGSAGFPSRAKVANNIIWAYSGSGGWTCTPPDPGSQVLVCTGSNCPYDYFNKGYFVAEPNLNANHGQLQDFRLAAGSPGINFGSAAVQAPTSIGTRGPDGFLNDDGIPRDAAHHSVGAYEFGDLSFVLAPSILPKGGTFTGSASITLACQTGGAAMYYTTNGSDPTQSSTQYTGTIVLTQSATLKVRAYKSGLDPSAVVSAAFTINADTQKPTLVSVYTGTAGNKVFAAFSEPVDKVAAEATANYQITGGPVSISSAALGTDKKTVTLTTGTLAKGTTYTLTVNNVKDLSGNVITANTQATFKYGEVESGLAGYWPLDNQDTGDKSGNSGALILQGATWGSGNTGGALSFDGADDNAVMPAGLEDNMTDFTFAAWVFWKGGDPWQRIFDFNNGPAGEYSGKYMALTAQPSNAAAVRFVMSTGGWRNAQAIDGTVDLPKNQWAHVGLTLNGTTGTLYINGSPAGTHTINLDPKDIGATNNFLGKSAFAENPYLNGLLDEVRVYSRALSQVELQGLMAGSGTTIFSDRMAENQAFEIFPLPFSNTLTVKAKGFDTQVQLLELYDCLGNFMVKGDQGQLDTRALVPGIYYITINGNETRRVVKID